MVIGDKDNGWDCWKTAGASSKDNRRDTQSASSFYRFDGGWDTHLPFILGFEQIYVAFFWYCNNGNYDANKDGLSCYGFVLLSTLRARLVNTVATFSTTVSQNMTQRSRFKREP